MESTDTTKLSSKRSSRNPEIPILLAFKLRAAAILSKDRDNDAQTQQVQQLRHIYKKIARGDDADAYDVKRYFSSADHGSVLHDDDLVGEARATSVKIRPI